MGRQQAGGGSTESVSGAQEAEGRGRDRKQEVASPTDVALSVDLGRPALCPQPV